MTESLLSLSDRIGMQAVRQGTDDALGTFTDVLIDVESGRLVCALFELGRKHGYSQAMFSPDKIKAGDDAVMVSVGDEEIAAQTRNQTAPQPTGLNVGSLPPVVVGPFGYTVAPAMASAMLNALLGRRSAKRRKQPDLDKRWSTWFWFTNLQCLPVFDVGRSLGELADIHVDRESWACLKLETLDKRQDRQRLPFARLRNVDPDETSIVMEMSDTPPYSTEAIVEDLEDRTSPTSL